MKAFSMILLLVSYLVFFSCSGRHDPDLGLAAVRNGRSGAVSSHAKSDSSNADRIRYIQPGETAELANLKGPGIINHIWLTFNEARPNWLEAGGSANPAEIVLRIYWDNASEPAVESPLGDFFAAGFGLRMEIISASVIVESGDGYNCFWTMPLHKAAKITLTNEGDKAVRSFYYQIDYTEVDKLPENTAYFCAQYRQGFPEKIGNDYLIMEAEGKGHYIGTVMSVRSRSPYWFGEGDAKFYIDGEEEPSIWGTGTEDYFLCAWGLNECITPYFGCTCKSMDSEEDLGVKFTLYRWHMADPVRFNKSLKFMIEHKGWISADETETGEADFYIENEESRGLVVRLTSSYDYGIYRLFIDGVPIPNVPMTIDMDFNAPAETVKVIDLYSKNVKVKDYYLGSTTLRKGKHTIRFELVGQNSNSSGNYLGFDSFRLRERWLKKRVSLK